MPGLPETAWFELAPDWFCEILSPGTAIDDRAEKLPIYVEYGMLQCGSSIPDRAPWKHLRIVQESGACSLP